MDVFLKLHCSLFPSKSQEKKTTWKMSAHMPLLIFLMVSYFHFRQVKRIADVHFSPPMQMPWLFANRVLYSARPSSIPVYSTFLLPLFLHNLRGCSHRLWISQDAWSFLLCLQGSDKCSRCKVFCFSYIPENPENRATVRPLQRLQTDWSDMPPITRIIPPPKFSPPNTAGTAHGDRS